MNKNITNFCISNKSEEKNILLTHYKHMLHIYLKYCFYLSYNKKL